MRGVLFCVTHPGPSTPNGRNRFIFVGVFEIICPYQDAMYFSPPLGVVTPECVGHIARCFNLCQGQMRGVLFCVTHPGVKTPNGEEGKIFLFVRCLYFFENFDLILLGILRSILFGH